MFASHSELHDYIMSNTETENQSFYIQHALKFTKAPEGTALIDYCKKRLLRLKANSTPPEFLPKLVSTRNAGWMLSGDFENTVMANYVKAAASKQSDITLA